MGFLPRQYVHHLLLLVQGTYCLLKDTVTYHNIAMAEMFIRECVIRFEQLYGNCHISYNVHILLHAPTSVQNWGPLWDQSAFIFESSNGRLGKLFHGTQGEHGYNWYQDK
jgi:hypothetical protein